MLRPHACVVPFESTGLPEEQRQGDLYVWIRQGAKNGRQRFVPLNTPERMTALAQAQRVVSGYDAHLGDPNRDLKRNLRLAEGDENHVGRVANFDDPLAQFLLCGRIKLRIDRSFLLGSFFESATAGQQKGRHDDKHARFHLSVY